MEQLGVQMKELFTGLTLKQEEDTCNRRLRKEGLVIKKQMVELEKEKMQQNSWVEQLMTALLRQMGGDQSTPMQPANAAVTPERSSRPAAVSEQAAAFRREGMVPSTQQEQARPTVVARQWDT